MKIPRIVITKLLKILSSVTAKTNSTFKKSKITNIIEDQVIRKNRKVNINDHALFTPDIHTQEIHDEPVQDS